VSTRGLCHFLVRLVLLDRNVSLFGMLDVHGSDLPVFYFDQGGVFSFVVDVVVTVVLEVVAEQLLPVMMVVMLHTGAATAAAPRRTARNDNHSSEKTLYSQFPLRFAPGRLVVRVESK
jgi:hypothetical protein